MVSIEEVQVLLNEVAEELPQGLYKDLNGGIILLPEVKLHKKSIGDDLYVMGEYRNEMISGRYIIVYYGSIHKLYGHYSKKMLKNKLREVIKHEFIHHLESLAGERHLEIEDERQLKKYLKDKEQI